MIEPILSTKFLVNECKILQGLKYGFFRENFRKIEQTIELYIQNKIFHMFRLPKLSPNKKGHKFVFYEVYKFFNANYKVFIGRYSLILAISFSVGAMVYSF